MTFQVRREARPPVGGLDGTIFVLEESGGAARAEVFPAFGFNCYRWQARGLDLLYWEPQHFLDGRPTRCGIPILFPFPNRIRDGRFTWAGKEYRLPPNDSSGKNAIHGFACRKPWRVVGHGADGHSAWVTGEFQAGADAPEARPLWPADYRLRVTFRLAADRLRVEAQVENLERAPLPFGLGYHPYFRVPLSPGGKADDCRVQAGARSYWELQESLPTGTRKPVDAARDLNAPRRFTDLQLDDVLTDLESLAPSAADVLVLRGAVRQGTDQGKLELWAAPAFRELVLFTPPHRQAVCLEPYTCTTDAVNLQARGVEAGWLVLAPGQSWSGVVEMRV